MTLTEKIEALNNLKIYQAFDWHYILNDDISDYDALIDEMENQGLMQVEIIYYDKAIKFLSEHDPSLNDSMEIAKEYETPLEFINSEYLASILATQMLYNELSDLQDNINEILESE